MGEYAKFYYGELQTFMKLVTLIKLSGKLDQDMINALEQGVKNVEQNFIKDAEDKEALESYKDYLYGLKHLTVL